MTKVESAPKPTTRRGCVVDAVKLTASAMHLVVQAGEGRFAFEPGQYVALSLDSGGGKIKKYFSIASAPNESNRFELCVREPPDRPGLLAHLDQMKKPESIEVWGPAGNLTLRRPPRSSVFVASGTGIAPMRSMLRTIYGPNGIDSRLSSTLLFGARKPEDIYYADEFGAMEQAHPNFRFCPTLTAPPRAWEGCRGRVLAHLADCIEGNEGDLDVYICGQSEMVEEARDFLAAAGITGDSVIHERFG